MAVGGYGRGEMALYSDVDVTFSTPRICWIVPSMGEVTVQAREDRRWARRLRRFERLFLGETANAGATTIVNPEVLNFSGSWGTLRAEASAPLILENTALGYRIQYFLKEFEHTGTTTKYDGEPLYEEMMPESTEQAMASAIQRSFPWRPARTASAPTSTSSTGRT